MRAKPTNISSDMLDLRHDCILLNDEKVRSALQVLTGIVATIRSKVWLIGNTCILSRFSFLQCKYQYSSSDSND